MRTGIVAGAVFPDYELTDHTGTRRKLSDLQGADPMILVLSRWGGLAYRLISRGRGRVPGIAGRALGHRAGARDGGSHQPLIN